MVPRCDPGDHCLRHGHITRCPPSHADDRRLPTAAPLTWNLLGRWVINNTHLRAGETCWPPTPQLAASGAGDHRHARRPGSFIPVVRASTKARRGLRDRPACGTRKKLAAPTAAAGESCGAPWTRPGASDRGGGEIALEMLDAKKARPRPMDANGTQMMDGG